MDSDNPKVGIVMGSDSDWPLVQKACATLDGFGVPYETRVISAHRTPELALEYSRTAEARGIQVIIAAAGKAAHLAGVAEVVADGRNGFLFPPDDGAAFQTALLRLAADSALRSSLGAAAHRDALQLFDLPKVVQDTASPLLALAGLPEA